MGEVKLERNRTKKVIAVARIILENKRSRDYSGTEGKRICLLFLHLFLFVFVFYVFVVGHRYNALYTSDQEQHALIVSTDL